MVLFQNSPNPFDLDTWLPTILPKTHLLSSVFVSFVIQRLKALTDLKIDGLIRVLEKKAPGCLAFLEQLQRDLKSIPVEFPEDSEFTAEQIREWAIEEVCLQQAMKDETTSKVDGNQVKATKYSSKTKMKDNKVKSTATEIPRPR